MFTVATPHPRHLEELSGHEDVGVFQFPKVHWRLQQDKVRNLLQRDQLESGDAIPGRRSWKLESGDAGGVRGGERRSTRGARRAL